MVMLSIWWSYQVLMISWHEENKSAEMRDTCCAQESAPEERRYVPGLSEAELLFKTDRLGRHQSRHQSRNTRSLLGLTGT